MDQQTGWDQLLKDEQKYNDYEYPKVSVILPTCNCAEMIATTVDSILEQNYPDFELIVLDANSTDHTLEIIKGLRSERILVYNVSEFQRYEMINKGITHASGMYINILFPGDFYLSPMALKYMMNLALDHELPNLVFCGTLLRDGKTEVKTLFRHLSLKLLRRGQQPTSLQSCWFKKDTFEKVGKFDTKYQLRGGYDLLCRYCLYGHLKTLSKNRVLTDYDLRFVTRKMIRTHFFETLRIIWKYFGVFAAFRWLFLQNDMKRYFKHLSKNLRGAFFGR